MCFSIRLMIEKFLVKSFLRLVINVSMCLPKLQSRCLLTHKNYFESNNFDKFDKKRAFYTEKQIMNLKADNKITMTKETFQSIDNSVIIPCTICAKGSYDIYIVHLIHSSGESVYTTHRGASI